MANDSIGNEPHKKPTQIQLIRWTKYGIRKIAQKNEQISELSMKFPLTEEI